MDTIANMLTSIRNAVMARKSAVVLPYSKMKHRIAEVLRDEKFVGPVIVSEEGPQKTLEITLIYLENGVSAIRGIERVSKNSRRWYVRKDEMPRVLSGLGIAVISTSKGLMTDKEARKKGIGGEMICRVW